MLDHLTELCLTREIPDYLRSDHGSEFAAGVVREGLARLRVRKLYIEPGSPCGPQVRRENGYVESCNGGLRDELPNLEIFDFLRGGRC